MSGACAAAAVFGGNRDASGDPLSASASPASGDENTTFTCTASGGATPYSYQWTKVSGDTLTPSAATSASTSFSGSPGQSGQYKCVVTDNNTDTADSDTVQIDISI